MTAQEIVDLLEKKVEKESFEYLEGDGEMKKLFGLVVQADVEGGEGRGESYHIVNHFVTHSVYIKLRGFYASYSGVDYSGYDYEIVQPKQVEVTVYVSVPK